MLSRLQGKQNLWWFTDGHWTKWVSSRRSWQIVHLSVGLGGVGFPVLPPPVDVPVAPAGPPAPLPPLPPPADPFAPEALLLFPGLTPSTATPPDGDWPTEEPLFTPPGPPEPLACPPTAPAGPVFGGGPPAPGSPIGFVPLVFAALAACALASVEVTVVLDTCLEPDDRRPLDEPSMKERKETQIRMGIKDFPQSWGTMKPFYVQFMMSRPNFIPESFRIIIISSSSLYLL